ncbi:MAG: ribonuclease P protein component [Candidatus Moraniibacteriota bacterium]|nr:MAG: ribonuclease P protein component [Candidatus Moranbacteria bacterium]
MLSRDLRLQGRGAFEAVFRTKKSIFGTEIGLFFRSNGLSGPRIGFAFKQKAFPRSATRHFLKRKGSAIMEELASDLPRGLDVVVLFHKPFSRPVKYGELKGSLVDLIKRLNQAKK